MQPEPLTAAGALAAAGAFWRGIRALNLGEVLKTFARGKTEVALERERRETVIAVTAHVPPGAQLTLGATENGGPSLAYTPASGAGQDGGEDL